MHPQVGKVGLVESGGRKHRCVIVWREGIYVGVRRLPDFDFVVLHTDQVLSEPAGNNRRQPWSWARAARALRQAWKALRFDPRKSFTDGPPVTSMGVVGWFRIGWSWYRAVALMVHDRSVYVRRAPDLEAFEVPLQDFVPEDCIEHVLPDLSLPKRLSLKWSLRMAKVPYQPSAAKGEGQRTRGLPPGHHPLRNLHRRR